MFVCVSGTADADTFPALKTELEVAATAVMTAVAPLLQVLGSQSALRTRLLESGREPYWLLPGPGINVMPEMARVQMVLLQASMHLVGAAKELAFIVKAMEAFVVRRSRALLGNLDEVRHSVNMAILVCREGAAVLGISPSLRKCTTYKDKLIAAAKRLHRLREHMEAVRVRSSLGEGPLTRQPSIDAELALRAHGLLQKTGVLLLKGTRPMQVDTGGTNDAATGEVDEASAVADVPPVQQPQPSPRRARGARNVRFNPSPQPSPALMPDLYQPALAETEPPTAWGKTGMKSRLKMLLCCLSP